MNKTNLRPSLSSTPPELRSHPAVKNYTLFCLMALFVLVVCLADRRLGWWCLTPALIGSLTLLTHWSYGPPMVLLSLLGLLGVYAPRSPWNNAAWSHFQTPRMMDLVLCIAVLAYVLGHYRLLSLMRNIFPPDPRRRSVDSSQRRSADLVSSWEMALLGLSLPLWMGLTMMLWTLGMVELKAPAPRELEAEPLLATLRELGPVWACLVVVAAVGTAVSYLRWTTATPQEQLVFLQDQCWRHTRREQGLLNRWLMWARSRAQRKKEPS